jgi:multiple sugar transport system permease protein
MVWRLFPFVFVMILAGLQSIPKEMYEAAMVDGASGRQRFIHITLPYLRFVIAIVWLLTFVWSFNDFSVVLTMTKGGPGYSTMVLPFRVYRFIVDGFRLGKGSALAMIMVAFLCLVAVLYVRLLRRQSEEGFMA